jgi:hypothetical protein
VGYYNGGQTPPGVDMANGYGLYDMTGNALEWCNDWYDYSYYTSCPYDNPQGPSSGTYRVIRGGSWNLRKTPCPARTASGTSLRSGSATTGSGWCWTQIRLCFLFFCRLRRPQRGVEYMAQTSHGQGLKAMADCYDFMPRSTRPRARSSRSPNRGRTALAVRLAVPFGSLPTRF